MQTLTFPASPQMSIAQSLMHYSITERTKERLEKWKTQLLAQFFDIHTLKYPATLGLFTWSCDTIHIKWLYRHYARNYGGGWITPGDLARDYVALKFPNRRVRCTTSQWKACVETRKEPPLYTAPGVYENATYFDLKGAYWQIVRSVGWDVSYNPGRWLGVNSDTLDFPYPHEKMARNCLVSIGLTSRLRLWTGEKIVYVHKPNRFINLVLWRLVQDVLNGIAADMVKIGAVYVYTDGYIVPRERDADAISVLESWGADYTIKHAGYTHVKAPAAYRCGDYQTRPYARTRRDHAVDKIDNSGSDWLKARYAKRSEAARRDWMFLNDPI